VVAYSAEGDKATTGRVNLTVSGRFVDVVARRPFTWLIRSIRSPFHSAEEPFWGEVEARLLPVRRPCQQ
jgi:hypothetical protein